MVYNRAEFSEKRLKAISLFEKGHGYKAVASALNVSAYTVRDWARHWRCNAQPNDLATEADKNKVVAMRQAGASLMEIVAEVRFSKRTVLCWLSEARQKGTLRA